MTTLKPTQIDNTDSPPRSGAMKIFRKPVT